MPSSTEFQRTLASVEVVEELVWSLRAPPPPESCRPEEKLGFEVFGFDPPLRKEPAASVGGEWLVIGSISAFEGQILEEQKDKFQEVKRRLFELEPAAARLRRKCDARAELELIRAQLREQLETKYHEELPDSIHASLQPGGSLEALQIFLAAANSDTALMMATRPLVDRALELERLTPYGVRMNEQVLDLLSRLDAAHALFNTDVVPQMSAAVAALDADLAERKHVNEIEASQAEEDARKRALEEAQRPVIDLIAASKRALQERRELEAAIEDSKRRCEEREALMNQGAAKRTAMPSLTAGIYL